MLNNKHLFKHVFETKLILLYLIYILINLIFIIKYMYRITNFYYTYAIFYLVIIVFFVTFYWKISVNIIYYKIFFWLFAFIFLLFSVYINLKVNGNVLNVDRWSALDGVIKAIIRGEYPYSASTHLGGRSSNLPTLILIGFPFYLMGDIGYLQSFGFFLFILILYRVFKNYKNRLFPLLLLIASPSYLWEIYVKSDLMTNFIIVLFVITFLKAKMNDFKSIGVTAIVSTALLLTRLAAIIPLSLWIFKKFYILSFSKKLFFMTTSFLTAFSLLYFAFHKVENIEQFKHYNPFALQSWQLPLYISIITIIIPLFYSFKVGNYRTLMEASTFYLFIPIIISFLIGIYKHGLYDCIFHSLCDISYFNILMPFLLISVTFNALCRNDIIKNFLTRYKK